MLNVSNAGGGKAATDASKVYKDIDSPLDSSIHFFPFILAINRAKIYPDRINCDSLVT